MLKRSGFAFWTGQDGATEQRLILQQAAEQAALERRWAGFGAVGSSDSACGGGGGAGYQEPGEHSRQPPPPKLPARLGTFSVAGSHHYELSDGEDDDVNRAVRHWLRSKSLGHVVGYVALLATSMEELVEVTADEISVRSTKLWFLELLFG